MAKCKLCGKEIENEEDLIKGVCEDCIEDYINHCDCLVENAIEIGEIISDCCHTYSINDYFIKTIDSEIINEILKKEALADNEYLKAEKYLLGHKEEFVKLILKEKGE